MKEIHLNSERIVGYRPEVAKKLGSIEAAVLIENLIFWSKRSKSKDGWFYKDKNEIEDETLLNRYQQDKGRGILSREKWIETKIKKANGAPTLHYKVNIQLLTGVSISNGKAETSDSKSETQEPIDNKNKETTEVGKAETSDWKSRNQRLEKSKSTIPVTEVGKAETSDSITVDITVDNLPNGKLAQKPSVDDSDNKTTEDKRNEHINLILGEFEARRGQPPIDKNPRQRAWNLVQKISGFSRNLHNLGFIPQIPDDAKKTEIIINYFDWLEPQDSFALMKTIDAVTRNSSIWFAAIKKSYENKLKEGGSHGVHQNGN